MSNSKLIYKIIVYLETSEFWLVDNLDFHVKENYHSVEYYSNGTKIWCLNGKRHREDGPAVEYSDGSKFWYLNGKELSEKKFKEFNQSII